MLHRLDLYSCSLVALAAAANAFPSSSCSSSVSSPPPSKIAYQKCCMCLMTQLFFYHRWQTDSFGLVLFIFLLPASFLSFFVIHCICCGNANMPWPFTSLLVFSSSFPRCANILISCQTNRFIPNSSLYFLFLLRSRR